MDRWCRLGLSGKYPFNYSFYAKNEEINNEDSDDEDKRMEELFMNQEKKDMRS